MIDTRTAPYAALLLRVSLGALLLAHGLLLKVFTFGIAGTAGYFESIGYPALFAYLVIAGEILGGIALILGVWTRWARDHSSSRYRHWSIQQILAIQSARLAVLT